MNIDKSFINSFAKSTERAAYGASLYKGKNDKISADKSAVDEMRSELNKIDMKGKVVIGEGEMDEAPMLFIGEEIGTGKVEELEIAVDPLEGTNFASKNWLGVTLGKGREEQQQTKCAGQPTPASSTTYLSSRLLHNV